MVIVQMKDNGPVVTVTDTFVQDERGHMREGVKDEGQDLSKEDESGINREEGNGNTEALPCPRQRQHPPQGPKLHRDTSFLPLSSLKVLLVENDDSTRHLISALLQNCGYGVTAVSNGLQAWKMLENLRNHRIDLVLTEVVLPCLSGIGLLSKIMGHKTWKPIPVIMMSSHDSTSTAFKCLSKGAVDFLVKPVRKNELKNLWQHVWRKCQHKVVPVAAAWESKAWEDGLDNVLEMGKDLEIGLPSARSTPGEHTENVHNKKTSASKEKCEVPLEDGELELDSEKPSGDSFRDADIIGINTNTTAQQLDFSIRNGPLKVSNTKEDVFCDEEMPSLELSLKRIKDFGDTGTTFHARNVLGNSDFSAFSSLSLENMAAAAFQCGSSNMASVPHFEGNAGNYSLTGPGAATGFGDRNGIDFNRSSKREAALNKFRQKRKERCFEKKVRYQSRKELAEQRPRIRGQFVRQAQDKGKNPHC